MAFKNYLEKKINRARYREGDVVGVGNSKPVDDGLEEELDEVWEELQGLYEKALREGSISKKQLGALCEKLEDIWGDLYEVHQAELQRLREERFLEKNEEVLKELVDWFDGSKDIEIMKKLRTTHNYREAEYIIEDLLNNGYAETINSDVVKFFQKWGFDTKEKGIGWTIAV
jgi:hypothetical protein